MVFFQVSKAVGLGISEGCVGPIGWPAFFEVLSFLERLAKRTAVGSWRFFSDFQLIRSVFTLASATPLLRERKLRLRFSAQIEVVMAIRTLARIVVLKVLT